MRIPVALAPFAVVAALVSLIACSEKREPALREKKVPAPVALAQAEPTPSPSLRPAPPPAEPVQPSAEEVRAFEKPVPK